MTKPQDESQMPPITAPGPGEGPESPTTLPRIEGYEITGHLGEGGLGMSPMRLGPSPNPRVAVHNPCLSC